MMCVESLFPPLMIILTRKKNRCIMILTASRGLPNHGHRLDNTAHAYYIQKKNKSGGNATGVTSGSASSFENGVEKGRENEKGNGVCLWCSSFIFGNEESGMGNDVEIIGAGASVDVRVMKIICELQKVLKKTEKVR